MNRDRLAQVKASLTRIGVTAESRFELADLPYFGHPGDWDKLVGPDVHPSQRATTSSRTPGKLNTGTVWATVRTIVACQHCGALMVDYPGAHAPRHDRTDPQRVVDCAGRTCVKDGAGYYQVAAP